MHIFLAQTVVMYTYCILLWNWLIHFHAKGYDDIPKEITDPDAKKVADMKLSHSTVFHNFYKVPFQKKKKIL